ncbi:MAG: glycine--tRNA ligase subunit beta [Terracidiphilus sp.]|jgi:glycyl-tRNA synthetase beta chain
MSDFLLELGLEEIPARMIAGAEAELGKRVRELLTRERLLTETAKFTTYSTPRRLAVLAEGVLAKQADTEEKLTGPSWKIAFANDTPTPVAEAFAKKAGVTVAELEKVTTPKGEYVGATVKRAGRTAEEILVSELPKEVLAIYWAKNMYWRAGKPERFVRPVRWVVALLDSNVVPLEIAGIKAGNESRGHRILHGEAPVRIGEAGAYTERLRNAHVVADVAERRHKLRQALDKATRAVAGARWREDEPLVETVTHLTEWPTAILGDFEVEYLGLPEEVLVTVMRDHQKYFAVESADGKLAPHFLAVLNTQTDEEGAAIIRHGNARVLRARFKDAQFFWDVDQKKPLADRMESLKSVTFQKQLGSYYWKTEQNLAVASALTAAVESAGLSFDKAALFKAVELAKTDLTTELVKEFTELQGIIGGLYARAQGLGDTVAQAIYDQYTPASIEHRIPKTIEGQLLGIADRIQTIVAMFSIGMAPTGSKDPFALRRAANAIVKILAESALPFTIGDLLDCADASQKQRKDIELFFSERTEFYLKDIRGFAYDVVNAVKSGGMYNVRDGIAWAEALNEARNSADFISVSAAFKRMKNILRQAHTMGVQIDAAPNFTEQLVEEEGVRLHEITRLVFAEAKRLIEQKKLKEALRIIGTLRPWIDAFFDKPVVVMHEDPALRGARLALVDEVCSAFAGIADFSEIVAG